MHVKHLERVLKKRDFERVLKMKGCTSVAFGISNKYRGTITMKLLDIPGDES